MKNILILPLLLSLTAVSHAYATSPDAKSMCTGESSKHLSKLQLKGETRFSDFQFDPDSTKVTDVEFTDMGEVGGRRHHRKQQTPAKPEYGQMLVMKAFGKEKAGWRNLVVKCGVNKGKLATFTYEILSLADKAPGNAPQQPLAESIVVPAASSAATDGSKNTIAAPTTVTAPARDAAVQSPQ